jgi:hypothetical protein
MDALISLCVFCQGLGALVGASTTVWGEFAYIRAMRDGKIDQGERAHLDAIAHGLRFGLTLLLLASFGLVIVAYFLRWSPQPALTTDFWMLFLVALLVIYASWALSRKKISFAIGSAIAFTGWWFLAYLALGFVPGLSFLAAVAFFMVATVIFYAILQYSRMMLGQGSDFRK